MGDSLFQVNDTINRVSGVSGDPVPYSVRTDDTLTIVMLAVFCLIILLCSIYRKFLWQQIRHFFYESHASTDDVETSGETYFLLFLSFVNCLMLAFTAYNYASPGNSDPLFTIDSHPVIIAIFTGIAIVYFLLKWALYYLVNLTFFGVKKNLQWMKNSIFLTALEGLLLYPVVTVHFYFNYSSQNLLYYGFFVLILNKILTFYKCRQIFFKQNDGRMQIFLYFCALEITPLLAAGSILGLMIDGLKINF